MHPFIIAALSADGFISPLRDDNAPSTTWTSGADKKFFVERTKKAGVVIMGLTTFQTVGRPLPDRLNLIYAPETEILPPGAERTDKNPTALLRELKARGFREAAICGGRSIYTLFLKSGLIQTLYLTIEPKLFGRGLNLSSEPLDIALSLKNTQQLTPDVLLLEYQILNGHPQQKSNS